MSRLKQHKAPVIGVTNWSITQYLIECPNIVRWNPPLAVDWMAIVSNRIQTFEEMEKYDKSAIRMNEYLDSLETMSYYDKEAVWGKRLVERVPLFTEMST
tara:strand:- start:1200 stop:1499 length:300 start_codon:yes stop_codon:yes gene_type:complete